MKKVVILLLSLFIILSASCITRKTGITCFRNSQIKTIIEKEIADTLKTNFGKSKVITIFFYTIQSETYLIFNTAPGYTRDYAKKYFVLENTYLVIYSGINDSIADKYLELEKMNSDLSLASLNFEDLDKCNCGYEYAFDEKFYKLKKNGLFIKFKPNNKHKEQLRTLLIKNGYIKLPPP